MISYSIRSIYRLLSKQNHSQTMIRLLIFTNYCQFNTNKDDIYKNIKHEFDKEHKEKASYLV